MYASLVRTFAIDDVSSERIAVVDNVLPGLREELGLDFTFDDEGKGHVVQGILGRHDLTDQDLHLAVRQSRVGVDPIEPTSRSSLFGQIQVHLGEEAKQTPKMPQGSSHIRPPPSLGLSDQARPHLRLDFVIPPWQPPTYR